MLKHKKILILLTLIILPVFVYFFFPKSSNETVTITEPEIYQSKFIIEEPGLAFILSAQKMIDEIAVSSKVPVEITDYFKSTLRRDAKVRDTFYSSLKFFKDLKGGYAAARYLALFPILSGSNDHVRLMEWTDKSLKFHSREIMMFVTKNCEDFFVDPQVHLAVLNMVDALDATKTEKLNFYAKNLNNPLPESNFEVLLGFMTQLEPRSSVVAALVKNTIQNMNNEKLKKSLENKLISSFPNLVAH